jgi:putative ABC transport system substrate-binding protein
MTGQFLYRRRDFIALIGGAAVAWPLAARAQPAERMRRVTVLMSTAKDDPQDATRLAAFARGLEELGWVIGRNLRTDYRWSSDDPDNARKYAAELATLAPDAIVASGSQAVAAVQQTSRTMLVVFVNIIDPVRAGFVQCSDSSSRR